MKSEGYTDSNCLYNLGQVWDGKYCIDLTDDNCLYEKRGCMDETAVNYDMYADTDDLCVYSGCTDPRADNYDQDANEDDGSCEYSSCECNTDEKQMIIDFENIIKPCKLGSESWNWDPSCLENKDSEMTDALNGIRSCCTRRWEEEKSEEE